MTAGVRFVPFTEPDDWDEELGNGAQTILPIQN